MAELADALDLGSSALKACRFKSCSRHHAQQSDLYLCGRGRNPHSLVFIQIFPGNIILQHLMGAYFLLIRVIGIFVLPAVLFVCFFLVFFLAAIGGVYHRHMYTVKPRVISEPARSQSLPAAAKPCSPALPPQSWADFAGHASAGPNTPGSRQT